MKNNPFRKVIIISVFLAVFSLQSVTAQTTSLSEQLSYGEDLLNLSGLCVDMAKKNKIGFYNELVDKHNASVDFFAQAEDFYKDLSKLRNLPSRFELSRGIEEYDLEPSQVELFTEFYTKDTRNKGRYNLERGNNPDDREENLLFETLKMIRNIEISDSLTKSSAGFLDNISRLKGVYSKSLFGVTTASPILVDKENEIINSFSALYSLYAKLEKDSDPVQELFAEYLAIQGRSSLSDDEKLYEYSSIETNINSIYDEVFNQIVQQTADIKLKADNAEIPEETQGLNVSDLNEMYEQATASYNKAEEARNSGERTSSLSNYLKAEKLYSQYSAFWSHLNDMDLFISEEIDPRDKQIQNKKQTILNLLGELLNIADSEDAYLVAEAAPLANKLKKLEDMASEDKESALTALDENIEKIRGIIALADSTGNSNNSAELDLDMPIVVDEESLNQHEQAFEDYLKEMSLAQEEGNFKDAASYYNKAQNELRMIEALKVNLLESRIQKLKSSYKEQANLFLSLSKSIKDPTQASRLESRATAISEKDSLASEVYASALEYDDFLKSWEIFREAESRMKLLNEEVLSYLKGEIRDQRQNLEKQNSSDNGKKKDDNGKKTESDILDFPLPDEQEKKKSPVNNDQTVPF